MQNFDYQIEPEGDAKKSMSHHHEVNFKDLLLQQEVPTCAIHLDESSLDRILAGVSGIDEKLDHVNKYFKMKENADKVEFDEMSKKYQVESERRDMELAEDETRMLNKRIEANAEIEILERREIQGRLDAIQRRRDGIIYSCDNRFILGLNDYAKDLTSKILRKQYKKSALAVHPDKNVDKKEAGIIFNIVAEAYANLCKEISEEDEN